MINEHFLELHKTSEPSLPAHEEPVTLNCDFLSFDDKVASIKSSLRLLV